MNRNFKLGMNFNDAVKETINYCLNNNVMPDYLFEHKKELNGMYRFEYDPVVAIKAMIEDARDEGIAQGMQQDQAEAKLSMVKNLLNAGASIELIKKATDWSEEQIAEIAEQK